MKLYKYVSPDRIDVLLNGQIRFTQAQAWNDPFELQPYYEDHIKKNPLKQLYKFAKIVNDYSTKGTIPSTEQIQDYEDERKRITRDDIYNYLNKKIIALSLTEEKENLLMWSHYANDHTGFVIEMDTETDFFKKKDRFLYKISYELSRQKVKTNEFATFIVEIINLISKKNEIPKRLLEQLSQSFKKGLHWSYENEWRLITITDRANNFKTFEKDINTIHFGSDHYEKLYIALLHLPLETVSAIYIGERAPRSLKRKLHLLIKHNSLYSHIKLMNTKIDDNEFKLNYKDVTDLDILKLAELKIDLDKTTKWQRFKDSYLNRYCKEITNIKKIRPVIFTSQES